MKKTHERRRRSIVKAVGYRMISIFVDSIVAYLFTRNATATLAIVALVNGYSTILYYVHERAWAHISWGKRDK